MPFTFAYPVFNIKKNKKGKTLLSQQSGKYTKSGGVYFTKSIYFWWWQFYKLSKTASNPIFKNNIKPSKKIDEDFGSIEGKNFKSWWFEKIKKKTRGEYLFRCDELKKVKIIDKIEADDKVLNLSVPLTLSKRSITRQIKSIISKFHKSKRGVAKKADRIRALYTPTNNKIRAYEKLYLLAEMLEKYPNYTYKQIWFKCLEADKNFSVVNDESINVDSINGNVSRMIRRLKKTLIGVKSGVF